MSGQIGYDFKCSYLSRRILMLLTISISVLVSKWKGHDTGHEKVLLWLDQTRKCLSVTVPGKPLEQDIGFNSIYLQLHSYLKWAAILIWYPTRNHLSITYPRNRLSGTYPWNHLSSTYPELCNKLTFLTPWDSSVCVSIRE